MSYAYGGGPNTNYPKPIKRSPSIFKGVMIIAIVGLVLFFVLPWITVERQLTDGQLYECNDCGYSSTDEWDFESYSGYGEDYECPECDSNDIDIRDISGKRYFHFNYDQGLIIGEEDEWGGDKLYPENEYGYSGANQVKSYMDDTIWLSFWGLLLAMIISIVYLSLEGAYSLFRIFNNYKPLILVIFSSVLIIFSIMIMTSGLRLLHMNVMQAHSDQIAEQIGYNVEVHQYFLAGYIMLIIGVIILMMAIQTVTTTLKQLETKNRSQPYVRMPLSTSPRKMVIGLMILTILILMFLPLLPYFGFSHEMEKFSGANEYDEDREKVEVLDFSMGSPYYMEIIGSLSLGGPSSYSDISDNYGGISTLSWASLIFLSLGLIGAAIYYMNCWRYLFISLFLTAGIAFVIISALSLGNHGFMIMNILDLGEEMSNSDSDYKLLYGYNYVPLIGSIIMLIFAVLFLSFVVKETRMTIGYYSASRYYHGPQPYMPAAPPPRPSQPRPRYPEPGAGRVRAPPPGYPAEQKAPPTEYGPYQGHTQYKDTGPVYGGAYDRKTRQKFCHNCGNSIADVAGSFCHNCGTKLD